MCANNLIGCAITADSKTIAGYATAGGRVTITENDIEKKLYFAVMSANGQKHAYAVNNMTNARILGEWPTPAGAYIAIEGSDPACQFQDVVVEVPIHYSFGRLMPVCGHFNFVPAENGLEAIGWGDGMQEIYLFKNGSLQGPMQSAQPQAQEGDRTSPQTTHFTSAAYAHATHNYTPAAPAVAIPTYNTAGLPQAAQAAPPSSSTSQPPSLDLVNH